MRHFLLCFLCCVIGFGFIAAPLGVPGKLRKAFEALHEYNYFAAKDGFQDNLKKNPVPSGYGLSVIYARSDNPFSNLDSAFHYIALARAAFSGLTTKQLLSYQEIGVDLLTVMKQVVHVDSLALLAAIHTGEIAVLQAYIDQDRTLRFSDLAIAERNATAFEQAELQATSAAFRVFLEAYPDAPQAVVARSQYNKLLYQEMTAGGLIRDYQRFIESHPDSPYREDAEYEVFAKFTRSGVAGVFKQFIEENPNNPFTDQAWRNLYALEVGDNSPKSIALFTLKYPEYPFLEELRTDFNLATTRFYSIHDAGKWGFVDDRGKVRIEPQYDWTESFKEELALVGLNDEAFYINKKNKPISSKRFADGVSFSGGYAVVQVDEKQGIINRLGQWVARPNYDVCGEYHEGFFYFEEQGLFGYMNRLGEVVIPAQFSSASDFLHGRAIVGVGDGVGYIDTLGNKLGAVVPHGSIEPFNDQYLARFKVGEKVGLMAITGDTILKPQYDALGGLYEGLMLAAQGDKYGFVNAQGKQVIPMKYHFDQQALTHSTFTKGRAKVYQKIKKDIFVGVIDSSDAKLIPAMFKAIGSLDGELIAVQKKDTWGYVDWEMNLKIPYQFESAGSFADSSAVVSKNGKYGLIDEEGNATIDFLYREMLRIDTLLLVADSAWGIVDRRGAAVLPLLFAEAEIVDDHVVKFQDKDRLVSYFDFRRLSFLWHEPRSNE